VCSFIKAGDELSDDEDDLFYNETEDLFDSTIDDIDEIGYF
jgi:hypothetical protein